MPYIKQTERDPLQHSILPELGHAVDSAGELNYVFSIIIKGYMDEFGLNYSNINDVLGALEGAKLEFYRRIVVPYEEKKRAENGDVY